MNGRERFRYGESLLNRPVSRRRFNAVVVEAAWVAGLSSLVLGTIGYLIATKEDESQQRYGEVVDKEVKRLVVDNLPDYDPILRSELSLADEDVVGYLSPGAEVEVVEVLGPVYPSPHSDFRTRVGKEEYGIWYKLITPLDVRLKDDTIEKRTGFIAGNFLKKPEEVIPADK